MATSVEPSGPADTAPGIRWGRQTALAVENFPISGRRIPPRVIHVLGHIKAAAAAANGRSPDVVTIDADLAAAIAAAATEVADGRWDDQFPVDVYQTGSGTSSNMNANEVIASRAAEIAGEAVHPNDHVNASQSSNDVFPTAVRLATALAIRDDLVPALDSLVTSLRDQAARHADEVTVGRTHMMDAAPMFMGQQFEGWAAQLASTRRLCVAAVGHLSEVPLGGTAVGTGLNVPPGWVEDALAALRARTDLDVRASVDRFAAQGGGEAYLEASAAIRAVAVAATKVASDIRLLASGPHTGIGELHLPELQAGSSIMPGKVNPVIPEAVLQVAARVAGNDATIAIAASGGVLQLNTFQPLVADVLAESVSLLGAALAVLDQKCVRGIEVDAVRSRAHALASPALITGLAAQIGYDRATELVKRAEREGRPLGDVLSEEGVLDGVDADEVLDPAKLARGGLV